MMGLFLYPRSLYLAFRVDFSAYDGTFSLPRSLFPAFRIDFSAYDGTFSLPRKLITNLQGRLLCLEPVTFSTPEAYI